MLTKKTITVLVLLLSTTSIVYANSDNSSDKKLNFPFLNKLKNREEVKTETKERVNAVSTENRIEACKRIVANIQDRAQIMTRNRDAHLKNYGRVIALLRQTYSSLEEKGYDISKLKDDTDKLDNLVAEYRAMYEQLLSLLDTAKDTACTEDTSGMKIELQYAKDQLIGLVRKRQEIRTFYKDNIREDISQLRMQVRERNSQEDTNE